MDFFEFLGDAPLGSSGRPSHRREPNERLASGVGLVLLPAADFAIVIAADLQEHPLVAMGFLPLLLTAASILVSRIVSVSGSWSALVAVGCLLLCVFVSTVAAVLAAFASLLTFF